MRKFRFYPSISIIIVTLNAEKILPACLKYIEKQTYPAIKEVLIVDGGSTDSTLEIAKFSQLPIKIIKGGYKYNQEARRAIGVEKARSEICAHIDSDNYLLDKNWLKDMVTPLLENKTIIATQTLRYAAPKNTTIFNRYFGLVGASDPIAYYLGKTDRLSWSFDTWNLRGNIIEDNKKYLVIDFDKDRYPTLGCNGIVFRRSILLKSKWNDPENYVHTDVFIDIARLGYTRFAIVKNEIFHNTSEHIFSFFKKRRDYMLVHHARLGKNRRYKVFDKNNPEDIRNLFIFVFFAVTLIQPAYVSLRGYLKKQDIAWFLHPVVCLGIMFVYSEAIISNIFRKK